MKYVFIEKHQAEFSIKAMCRVLCVARSGWYAWRSRCTVINARQRFRHDCDSVVSNAFSRAKQRYGAPRHLRGSMSARGNCYDNACAESFFHSLKVECIHGERFASREMMRSAVFNYIECDYNRWRRHSACGGVSPGQFENQTLA